MTLMTLTCSGLDVLAIPGNRGCFEQQGQGLKDPEPILTPGKRQSPSLTEAHDPLREDGRPESCRVQQAACCGDSSSHGTTGLSVSQRGPRVQGDKVNAYFSLRKQCVAFRGFV